MRSDQDREWYCNQTQVRAWPLLEAHNIRQSLSEVWAGFDTSPAF